MPHFYSVLSKLKNSVRILCILATCILMGACEKPSKTSLDTPREVSSLSSLPSSKISVLVEPAWLINKLNDPSVKLVEFSKSTQSYNAGHIKGAHYLDWRTDIIEPNNPQYYSVLSKPDYEKLMGRLGITAESTVVLYDEMNSRAAIRFFWTMRYYGHDEVKILDGGKSRWVTLGFPLSTEAPQPQFSEYSVSEVNQGIIADISAVKDALRDDGFVLVDGRPFAQYTGKAPGSVYHTSQKHQRLGHIFGAKSVPWKSNFRSDGTFKSAEELSLIYEGHHIVKGKSIIAYCNEGLHAAVPWFVLTQLLDYENVALYDNSLAEWANREDTPMVTGKRCM